MAEPSSMIASAEHLTGPGTQALFSASSVPWHADSWRLYDSVGEYNTAGTWIANALSQFVVKPQVWSDGEWIADTDEAALGVVRKMGSQAELFKMWGENSVVAAEAFWALIAGRWRMVSRASLIEIGGRLYFDRYGAASNSGEPRIRREPVEDAWRIFLPHARFPGLPHSPVQAFLTDLDQLLLLRRVLNSKLNTRLWMNGIWVFGQRVQLPAQSGRNTPGRQGSFLTELKKMVGENMRRRDTSKDIEPIFMQVATPEVGDVVKQYYPEVTIDEREAELRHEIRNGLREMFDLPVEMQTSMKDVNHWGSWSIPEANLRYSLLPRASAMLDALSLTWYQDELIAAKMSAADASIRRLAPDPSNLAGSPSSDEVRQAHRLGVVSDTVVRSATRLTEDAKPDEDEYVRIVGRITGQPYLALWGTEVWKTIEADDAWDKVGVKTGRPTQDGPPSERAPGVGDPGAPTDPNSEVGAG